MPSQDDRPHIPVAIERELLKEYNYRCAICGVAVPQIHHIDGNRKNNDINNLLPICPNCHLLDQHNPTRKIETRLLTLFRRHKDPAILAPQFVPLFERLEFLDGLRPLDKNTDLLIPTTVEFDAARKYFIDHIFDLLRMVRHLKMGDFYAFQLSSLFMSASYLEGSPITQTSDRDSLVWQQGILRKWLYKASPEEIEDHLYNNRDTAIKLVIEQLRFQDWDVSRAHRWG